MSEPSDPRQAPPPMPLMPPTPPAPPPGAPVLSYRMPGSVDPFLPVRGRANLATAVLVIWALWSGVSLLSSYRQLDLLYRAESEGISQAEADANDRRESLVKAVAAALYLGCVTLFLMWLNRVRKNLPALGVHDARHSPGWAIGSWFIPILNLFRPYQIVREIDQASDPRARLAERPWQDAPGSSLVGWWWAAWIIALIASRVARTIGRRAEEVPELVRATTSSMASIALTMVAGLLCVAVIRRVTANQEHAFDTPGHHVPLAAHTGEAGVGAGAGAMPEYPTP